MTGEKYNKTPNLVKKGIRAIPLGDTATLTNEEWLKWRDHGPNYDASQPGYIDYCIGGSDVAAVLNVSPWKANTDLYDSKKNIIRKHQLPPNEIAFTAGHRFEPFVADMVYQYFQEQGHTVEIINDTTMYRHGELLEDANGDLVTDANGEPVLRYPFALANLDRLIDLDGELGILEIKTTNLESHGGFERVAAWKNGIVPLYYELQVRYYLAIMNLPWAYIACAWGFRQDQMAVIKIERELDVEENMMEAVKDFVDEHLRKDVPPDIWLSDKGEMVIRYINELYDAPPAKAPVVDISEEVVPIVELIYDYDQKIAQYKKNISAIESARMKEVAKLYPYFGDTEEGCVTLPDESRIYLTLTQPRKKPGFDEERFQLDHPDLYEKSMKFDPALAKKLDKKVASKYVLPAEPNKEKVRELKPIKKVYAPKNAN